MDDKKHILAITALIKNQDGNKFLIIKRNVNEIAFPGKWAFPGGKLEKGETISTTLKREVKEEVGLDITDSKELLKDYTFVRKDGHNVVGMAFLVQASHQEVKLDKEFEDYKWITPDELKNYDHIEGMEKEVEQAFKK